MNNIGILVDSSVGYTSAELKNTNINSVELKIIIDSKIEINDNDKEYNENNLDDLIKNNKSKITTSQTNQNDFEAKFDLLLQKYDQIICFFMAKRLSGQFNSAQIVSKKERFKDKIFIYDSKTVYVATKYIIKYANKYLKEGKTIPEIFELLPKIEDRIDTFLIPSNNNLIRLSGRATHLNAVNTAKGTMKFMLKWDGKVSMYNCSKTIKGLITSFYEYSKKAKDKKAKIIITMDKIHKYYNIINNNIKNYKIKAKIVNRIPNVWKVNCGTETIALFLIKSIIK